MRKIYIFIIIICCLLTANSCSYDNFDEPKSMLTGKAIYNGEPVSVRSGSPNLPYFKTDMPYMVLSLSISHKTEVTQ